MPTPHELEFYVQNRFLTGQEDGFAIYELKDGSYTTRH